MYRFIFGAAGTGKTTYIYKRITEEAIKNPETKYFLFVPEQNTLKAQQELIRQSPRHGMLNLDVLSFNLLAYRVFDELGIEVPEILNEMTKSLFLRKACQEVKDELKVYKNKLGAAGFIHQIKSIITEFFQYNVSGDRFDAILQNELNPLLKSKLEDIRLISDYFLEMIDGNAIIAEELPVLLLKQLGRSELLKDAVIIFDGFTGFTPIQLSLLSHIMSAARDTTFSVTIPYSAQPYNRATDRSAVADLWWLSKETVAKLCIIAEKNGIMRDEDIVFDTCHIEPKRILINADNPEEEIKRITADIVKKTRTCGVCGEQEGALGCDRGEQEGALGCDRGEQEEALGGDTVRYRNIAVAVSDPTAYREIIKRSFDEAELPYFIDDTSDGFGNASIELLRSVLGVINDGYAYDDVLRFAKNALMLYMGAESSIYDSNMLCADQMDNYIRAKGIRGRKRYEQEWHSTYRGAEDLDLNLLNEYRDKLFGPVFELHDGLKAAGNISEMVGCIKSFMDKVELKARNEAFTAMLDSLSYTREAKENIEFYEMLSELLDSISNLLGKEKMTVAEFTEIFEAGAADLKAGMLPQTIDMIVVGDLKRSRFDNIDVLYIVGANDGLLPQVASGGGIFTDQERAMLREADMELAPLDREDICIQNFYIYLLLNKPRLEIIMSYSSANRDGIAMKPSSVIAELERTSKWEHRNEAYAEDMVFSEDEALLYYSQLLSDDDAGEDRKRAMYAYLKENAETALRADRVLRASLYRHEDDRISEEEAAMLYGKKLYGSVTRIESYEKCAYAHFLTYGLKLLERQQYDIEAFDIGNLYHQSIESVFSELAFRNILIQDVDQEELDSISDTAVEQVVNAYNDQIMQSSARNVYISKMVKKITKRTLWAIRQQLIRGDFVTMGCELPFAVKDEHMELRGRIDRVDICDGPTKVYVKVIDYKSGNTSFDLSLVYHGLQLQLITYMDIALKEAEKVNVAKGNAGKPVAPGGMYYYRVTNPMLDIADVMGKKTPEAVMLEEFLPNGLTNKEEAALSAFDKEQKTNEGKVVGGKATDDRGFGYLLKHTEHIMKKDVEKILGGDINKRPYMTSDRNGCEYCRYHSICGFDERMEGFDYRHIYKLEDDVIWSKLKQQYGEEEPDISKEQLAEDETGQGAGSGR